MVSKTSKAKPAPVAHLRSGTVASLAEALYTEGPEAVLRELGRHKGKVTSITAVVSSQDAEEVKRRDNLENDPYWDYSPPPLWQPAYQVMRARFTPAPKAQYMTHVGEEIVVPTSGKGIIYSQLMPVEGVDGFALERRVLPPLPVGGIMRVQPGIPHHTWCAHEPAEAWMVFRDLSFNAVAIRSHKDRLSGLKARVVDEKYFHENPELYCLAAFGVSEKIRLLRDTAGLQIRELADNAGLDRAQLSKLEAGEANVSIDKLIRIGEELGFDPFDAFQRKLWGSERDMLEPTSDSKGKPGKKVELDPCDRSPKVSTYKKHHYLHARYHRLPAGASYEAPIQKMPLDTMSSWIALEGVASFLVGQEGKQNREWLETGKVLHLREPVPLKVQAVELSRLIEITFSPLCVCDSLPQG